MICFAYEFAGTRDEQSIIFEPISSRKRAREKNRAILGLVGVDIDDVLLGLLAPHSFFKQIRRRSRRII